MEKVYAIIKSDIDTLLSEEVQELIRENENTPVERLVLRLSGSKLPVNLLADQIKCRKKAMKKFPTFSSRGIIYESTAFEQSSSEATAIYKSTFMNGESLIDLTGGLGIDAITLSRNFERVIYSEINASLTELFNYNSAVFKVDNIEINNNDSIEYLKRHDGKIFDWIYLDPARREAGRRSVDLEFCSPNIYENLDLLKEKSNNICIKVSPAFDLMEAERKLPELTDYIVVSVNNECKEVLLLLKNKKQELKKHAVVLDEYGNTVSEFSLPAKTMIPRKVAEKPCKYFYEPDVAVIKSGLTNLIAEKYDLYGINSFAEFFTSENLVNNFPGRIFKIKDVFAYKPLYLKKYFKEKGIKKANISKREFLKSVAEIRKELKMDEGGDLYLFFTRGSSNQLTCFVTTKVTDHTF